jgi:hypothetical protein
MKNLILISVLLISFSLFAQDKVDVSKTSTNDETNVWMTRISSNSEMRSKMMDMMIAKTDGNKEEMMNLINSMINNPGMNKMIFATNSGRAENENISIEPRGMTNDSIKVGKVYMIQPMPRK